jgi:hypothetical protein
MMSMTTDRKMTGAGIAVIAAVLVLYVILGPGLHGLAGFGAGAVAGLLLAYGLWSRAAPPHAAPSPGAPAAAGVKGHSAPPATPTLSDAEALNAINLRVRSAGFTTDLVERIERLIDQLGEILPTLSSQFAGFELTWQMQQIASAYLPKLVNAYAGLTDAERPQKRGDFEEGLRELEDAAARTARALREQKTTEFENISRFLKLRFS